MLTLSVTHACGHTRRLTLQAPIKNPSAFIERQRARNCIDCWRAWRDMANAQEADARFLPPLEGTPKQVKWAAALRQTYIELIESRRFEALPQESRDALWTRVFRETHATHWIDTRQPGGNSRG